MFKKTKIICTVGPSTDKADILEKMLAAGMNVARFNFSHGNHAEQGERIALVRAAAAKTKRPIALLLDTKGPEMRLGNFADGKVHLAAGETFILTARDVVGTKEIVSVNHKLLPREVNPDDVILLSDGLVSLQVLRIDGDDIVTTVLNSGDMSNRKRVAVPGVAVTLPPLSEQDIADIQFGIEEDMDYIAASFIQRAADVIAIRKVLENAGADMGIISKIENAEGVKNIDEILEVSDGIMVARGDLGVEIPTEEVPLVQKMIIEKCNQAGKPVITATQMLESMVSNPRPTRAEASDIANAILDGTDVIMLSGETASGKYPVEAVETMSRIAIRTEAALAYSDLLMSKGFMMQASTTDAISHATVQVAHELGANAIVTVTESGYTARMVSKFRPKATIAAVSTVPKTLRRMLLYWGVIPIAGVKSVNSDEMVNNSIVSALSADAVKDGDLVVVTAGVPLGTTGTTNMIRVHVVGTILLRGAGVGKRAATGKVCIGASLEDIRTNFTPGDILVVHGVDEDIAPYAAKASAIIAEEGGYTSHAAIIGISFCIPVLIGAADAVRTLTNNTIVTVDASRGVVYQGNINAR